MTDARPKGAVEGPLVMEGTIVPPFPMWRIVMTLSWDRLSPSADLEVFYEETDERQPRALVVAPAKDPTLPLRKALFAEAELWVRVYPNAKLEFFDIRISRKIVQKGNVPGVLRTLYTKTYSKERRPLDVATAKVKAHVESIMSRQRLAANSLAEEAHVPPARVVRLLSGGRVPLADLWAIDKAARSLGGDFTPIPPVIT
ncbi:MAG: hypothetical protein HY898_07475 [Deltaproteobacteria bacterium]|nr:hypothetical protein [Deltaproteobacteria bacterium]